MIQLLFCVLCLLFAVEAAEDPAPGFSEGKMSFKPPKLSEEDDHSVTMPVQYRCEGCQAVAHQVVTVLQKAKDKQKKAKRLAESEYLDILDDLCKNHDLWNGYGIKEIDGNNHISGPGLPADQHAGMMHGGGKWPGRIMSMCYEIMGEIGEDEIYNFFEEHEHHEMMPYLCEEETSHCKKGTQKKDEL
jgi:hypothetical protein